MMANDARQRLVQQIREWNINRLDLFALSEPNQVSGHGMTNYRIGLHRNTSNHIVLHRTTSDLI